ncbi:MAG: TlpA family protein disulfide reductase [bacterium JZ-2024 1]
MNPSRGGGRLLRTGALAALIFTILGGGSTYPASASNDKPSDKPRKEKLPVFRAETADKNRISSEEFFKEQPVVLMDFWALWCRDCIAFMPHLQELKKKYGKDLLIVSVNTDTSQKATEVGSFIKSRGYDFLVILDSQQKVKQLLGVKMLPTMILTSWDGTIAERFIGSLPKLAEILDRRVAELLKERPPRKEENKDTKKLTESKT